MQDHKQLFQEQSKSWTLAGDNYRALSKVVFKDFQMDDFRIRLQCNPGRIVSTSANVSKGAIQARPCFLCAKNRPDEQTYQTFANGDNLDSEFQILVNPFPVFPEHFTIAATKHQPQTIKGNLVTLLKLANTMDDCVVFYNGPRCGASAPDHLHFQAGSKGLMPLESDYKDWKKTHLSTLWKDKGIEVYKMEGFLRNGFVLEGNDLAELNRNFELLFGLLEASNTTPNEESMLNLLCWFEKGNWICVLFPRKAHRPKCYFREDETKLMISPASVEMGGLMIAARLEDYERIGINEIKEIYGDVSASRTDIDLLSEQFLKKQKV